MFGLYRISVRQVSQYIHFCTSGSLVWKRVWLQYPKSNQPLFSTNDNCVQNAKGSVSYNLSCCMETILSTDGRWWQRHNIIRPQTFKNWLISRLIEYKPFSWHGSLEKPSDDDVTVSSFLPVVFVTLSVPVSFSLNQPGHLVVVLYQPF